MNGDLDAYVSALRKHAEAPMCDARATEARILAELDALAVARVRRLRFFSAVAVMALGATALAHVLGFPRTRPSAHVIENPRREVHERPDEPRSVAPRSHRPPAPSHAAASPRAVPSLALQRPQTGEEPSAEAPGEPAPEAAKTVASDDASQPGPTQAQLFAAYERARRLHFSATPAEALSAWDAFLALRPAGTQWETDARYRRGVVLFRLRRWEQARQALGPFAQGHFGAERAREARRILNAIPHAPPP